MKKGLHKKVLAGLLSFSLAVPAGGIFTMAGSIKAEAADDSSTVLSKILGAEEKSVSLEYDAFIEIRNEIAKKYWKTTNFSKYYC